jgi:hypothetical protein
MANGSIEAIEASRSITLKVSPAHAQVANGQVMSDQTATTFRPNNSLSSINENIHRRHSAQADPKQPRSAKAFRQSGVQSSSTPACPSNKLDVVMKHAPTCPNRLGQKCPSVCFRWLFRF